MRERSHKKARGIVGGAVSAAVIACFVICGRILWVGGEYLPGQWRGAWLSTFIAFAFSLLIFPFLAAVSNIVFSGEKRGSMLQRAVRFAVLIAVCSAAVFVIFEALSDGSGFARDVMGMTADERMIAAFLLLTAAYVAALGDRAIGKFSLTALAITVIVAAVLCLLSLNRGGRAIESIDLMLSPEAFREVSEGEGIKLSFLKVFAPCVVGAVWLSVTNKDGNTVWHAISRTLGGIAVGGAVLVSGFVTVVLSQGLAFASGKAYPYVSAAGSMTAGKLFMRPEGAVYLAYLAVLFSVLAVSLSLISRAVDGGRSKRIPYAAAAVILILFIFIR